MEKRSALIEELAQILHESGREAVEKGLVYMKGEGITPKPFCEWADLPQDAREGRRVQAAHILNQGNVVKEILEQW